MLVSGALLAGNAIAQPLEIIELKHRTAEQLIPLLRPFVVEGGTLTGRGNQLIVKTTPENLREIKKLLTNLDKALQQVVITVLQGEAVRLAEDEAQLRAALGIGSHGRIEAGRPDMEGNSAELRIRRTRSRHRREDVQRVRVLEGSAATLFLGQAIPLGSRTITRSPRGAEVTDSVEYRELRTGVAVIPRLSGDRVTLEITTRRDALSPSGAGRIDTGGIQTTVSGRLGEWIELGGISETRNGKREGIIYRSTRKGETTGRVLIRVERAP
ncbi:MAG: secretin N-terminal domain-containing protein [Gammaproteobacteria bacterium]